MIITFLIGNGFDLKLGMKTKYSDFYNYYKSIHSENNTISTFKKNIDVKNDTWADLELALGKYLANIPDDEDAITLYNDVKTELSKYITSQESLHSCSDSNKDAIIDDLMYPEKYFRVAEKTNIIHRGKTPNDHYSVNIISFNYTKTLEHLIGYTNQAIRKLATSGHQRYLSEIEHIHGFTSERLILGVNDISQIDNEDLKKVTRVLRRYVKSTNNDTYQLGHEQKCCNWISKSRIICIYGLSLGDSDKNWWIRIGERLKNNDCILLLFYHDNELHFDGNSGPEYQDKIDDIKEVFLAKTNLSKSEIQMAANNIFVAINSNIFDAARQASEHIIAPTT